MTAETVTLLPPNATALERALAQRQLVGQPHAEGREYARHTSVREGCLWPRTALQYNGHQNRENATAGYPDPKRIFSQCIGQTTHE